MQLICQLVGISVLPWCYYFKCQYGTQQPYMLHRFKGSQLLHELLMLRVYTLPLLHALRLQEQVKAEGVLCIAKAAGSGNTAALQTFRHAARWLAVGLANAVTATGPERIVLFGGIARNGDLLMAPLRERFHESLLNIYQGRVDLVTSALPANDAAILGAAALTTL